MNTEKCLNCNGDAKLFFIENILSKDYKCDNCGKITSYKYKKVIESATIKDAPKIKTLKKLQK